MPTAQGYKEYTGSQIPPRELDEQKKGLLALGTRLVSALAQNSHDIPDQNRTNYRVSLPFDFYAQMRHKQQANTEALRLHDQVFLDALTLFDPKEVQVVDALVKSKRGHRTLSLDRYPKPDAVGEYFYHLTVHLSKVVEETNTRHDFSVGLPLSKVPENLVTNFGELNTIQMGLDKMYKNYRDMEVSQTLQSGDIVIKHTTGVETVQPTAV